MFESNDRPPLEETAFEQWLEKGRNSKLGYHYMMVVWNAWEQTYRPLYFEDRNKVQDNNTEMQESLVAVYDLYSESRIG